MVHNRPDGRQAVTATVPEKLAREVEEAVNSDPELTEARLVREGLRRELQQRRVIDE